MKCAKYLQKHKYYMSEIKCNNFVSAMYRKQFQKRNCYLYEINGSPRFYKRY